MHVLRRLICFDWKWILTKYLHAAMESALPAAGRKKNKKKRERARESGRLLDWSYLKHLLSFNIDGLLSDGTSQRSKRVSENTLCQRNISRDSASLSSSYISVSVLCILSAQWGVFSKISVVWMNFISIQSRMKVKNLCLSECDPLWSCSSL